MNQPEKSTYATLFTHVRAQLGISPAEYWLLEMIYHLSHKTGYCYKTASSMAADLGLTKRGVNLMIERLSRRGLLERLTNNAVRVTDAYYSVQNLSGKKVPTKPKSGNKVPKVGTKFPGWEQSTPNKDSNNNIDYKKAREASAKVRASLVTAKKDKHNAKN